MTNKVEVEREDLEFLLTSGGLALSLIARQCEAGGQPDTEFSDDLKSFAKINKKYLGDGDE